MLMLMSAVETGQMSAAETGPMSAVETRQMYSTGQDYDKKLFNKKLSPSKSISYFFFSAPGPRNLFLMILLIGDDFGTT